MNKPNLQSTSPAIPKELDGEVLTYFEECFPPPPLGLQVLLDLRWDRRGSSCPFPGTGDIDV